MERLKFNPFFQIVFLGLLAGLNAYTLIYRPYKNKQDILNAPYGTSANTFRIKLHLPVIEKDMQAINPHNNLASNKWAVADQFPHNGKALHIYKIADADLQTLKPELETDAFRRKINDSVFEQLIVTYFIKADTLYKKTGCLFLVHNTGFYNYDNHENDLDSYAIDSISNKWGLNGLQGK